MKLRLAVAVLALLGLCSVAAMKHVSETKPEPKLIVDGGGGLPTPCPPPTVCPMKEVSK
jgi:hypothetical protein